jgi:molybdenum cofactor biosynthesis protein B
MSHVVERHRREAGQLSLGCAVVTVSDTRTPETDQSGARACQLLEAAGHRVVAYHIVPDEPEALHALIGDLLRHPECQVLLFNGGTGPSPRDRTVETVRCWVERELPGFGELFRQRSGEQVGSAAMLSRALAGVGEGHLFFVLPGSPQAVELALQTLILPELPHLWHLLYR